ncbi:MAG TPA: hypothetical protein H9804_07470 [Candidatus Mucispirillum faecigallinarum]|uniref:Tail fiber protein n=1 Tax=Candidatus Mucispirillum faecigallinarum TaxID=2838699 RepID=A0A9D2GV67_9BACT|nr:hypothetical protein [Candidatus Mucispirillum faecigallinarum]
MIPQQPDIILSPLGYSSDTRNIPATTPAGSNQLSFESGFPLLTSIPVQEGGLPPERQDFNAAFKILSEFIYFLQSGNHFDWSNQLDYNAGALVLGSDGALYYCIQANGATSPNTVQDPTTSSGYWVKVIDAQGVFNINIIADGAVSTAKLANSSVTNAKIANRAVNNAKISDVAASKVTGLATVATSGSYNDLKNKPTIPTNVAPLPVTGSGIGQWEAVGPAAQVRLPDGGTWAIFVSLFINGALSTNSYIVNVVSGGASFSTIKRKFILKLSINIMHSLSLII